MSGGFDITDTLAPKSDQLDAVDLLGGPRVFTIENVARGSSAEQPVQIRLAEFDRVWRPSKGMRRVLAACWGPDTTAWQGRRARLFCDPTVKFGGQEVGGIRIAALSHIDRVMKVPLLISQGRSASFTVEPLKNEPAPRQSSGVTAEQVAASTDLDELRGWYRVSSAEMQQQIKARVDEIRAQQTPADEGAAFDQPSGDTLPANTEEPPGW